MGMFFKLPHDYHTNENILILHRYFIKMLQHRKDKQFFKQFIY